MTEGKTAKRYYASGNVQGVGYRYFARGAARRLKICGYVRNLSDGRVEVYAQGSAEDLATLRQELQRGPSGAFVSDVSEQDAAIETQFSDEFSIEYDA